MERECARLLPGVLEVLAGSGRCLPDDSSLEKLLDWLSGLSQAGVPLLQSCPCLIEFASSVTAGSGVGSGVLTFALRLAGLLARTEEGFGLLQESSALSVFSLPRWREDGLWEDPSIRAGWVLGLKRMLQHRRALSFLLESDLLAPLLHLQTDSSLFVSAAATGTLAHLLLTFQAPSGPDTGQYAAVAAATLEHLKGSLRLEEPESTLQGLKLLTQLLGRAGPGLRDRLLRTLAGSLEALLSAGDGRVSLAVVDAVMAAQSSGSAGVAGPLVARLLSCALSITAPVDLVHVAEAFLARGRRDLVHASRAVRVLLQPLDLVTGHTLLDPARELTSGDLRARTWACLKARPSCVSVMCVCARNLPQVLSQPADVLPCPPAAIVLALVALLRICVGESASGDKDVFRNLVGSARVQKCALEALRRLSGAAGECCSCCDGDACLHVPSLSGAEDARSPVLTVLTQYLDHPDSDATVLDKSFKSLVEWTGSAESLTDTLPAGESPSRLERQLGLTAVSSSELTRVVRRRVCDQRWEVRDSSVEFLGLRGRLLRSDASVSAVLREALQDPESYVRASAAAALALQQGALSAHEQTEVVTRLLQVLSEDSEAFPRRAVLRFFITGLSTAPSLSSPLLGSTRTVLAVGSADLDWEVKVHTLELAELLLDRVLPGPRAHGADPAPDLQEALESLAQQRVWPVLLGGLLDWDRPVALKACGLLLRLRDLLCPLLAGGSLAAAPTCELPGQGWGREVRDLMGIRSREESVCVSVCDALAVLSLDQRLTLLTCSSDHVHNSPLSLLQDILTSDPGQPGATQDPVIVDCY
ncbi:integrator complex assembly factor BRAT1 [Neosynchiropus ocellatus]